MSSYKYIRIIERPELIDKASAFCSEKWHVPVSAYVESMNDALKSNTGVPNWYLVLDDDKIIATLGVIDNDFHKRKDLTPNIVAVYVDKAYRKQGIAGNLLHLACQDLHEKGIDTVYLITSHTSFYERYNWRFLTMVEEDDGDLIRVYIHEYE